MTIEASGFYMAGPITGRLPRYWDRDSEAREMLGQALLHNAVSLVPKLDWKEMLDLTNETATNRNFAIEDNNKRSRSVSAILNVAMRSSFGERFGSIIANASWELDSPEAAFFSLSFFGTVLDIGIKKIEERKKYLDSNPELGRNRQISEELSEKRKRLKKYGEEIDISMHEHIPDDEYKKLLSALWSSADRYRRNKILGFLKNGKLERAYREAGID